MSAEQIVGASVRRLRVDRGWSQRELARLMNMAADVHWGQSTVAKTEAADRPIRVNEAAALAGLLGVTLNDLAAQDASEVHEARSKEKASILADLDRLRDRIETMQAPRPIREPSERSADYWPTLVGPAAAREAGAS